MISKEQFTDMITLYLSLNKENRQKSKDQWPEARDIFEAIDKYLEAHDE